MFIHKASLGDKRNWSHINIISLNLNRPRKKFLLNVVILVLMTSLRTHLHSQIPLFNKTQREISLECSNSSANDHLKN